MTEFATWATHLLRVEQRAKTLSDLCEKGKWDEALVEAVKLEAHAWNAKWDILKKLYPEAAK